jgi:caffeoyl-CoA O-methyltransferase
LPADGVVITLEADPRHAEVARANLARAGCGNVEVRLGDAADTLPTLEDEAPFDLVFIDADKEGYVGYYEAVLPRLSEHGVIVADNTLAGGRVVEGDRPDIADFNEHVAADPRSVQVVLSVRDGMTVIRRA